MSYALTLLTALLMAPLVGVCAARQPAPERLGGMAHDHGRGCAEAAVRAQGERPGEVRATQRGGSGGVAQTRSTMPMESA